MINLKKELKKLNLSDNEASLYLSLLELGEASVQRISKKSKISRTTTYDVIETLREKGLIIATKKQKRTFYYAENPSKLGNILEEKVNAFDNLLPELLAMSNLIDRKPKIRFFEGVEGLKNIYKDTLNYPDSEILA
ncbi:MAG TPA: hypothetical protein EYG72_01610 [Candidatus Pacebacteria bacterium]|nr:hypothetical protein [Candidatus Paceibacterota bacterium]